MMRSHLLNRLRISTLATVLAVALLASFAQAQEWQAMERQGDKPWKKAERSTLETRKGVVVFERRNIGQGCATAVLHTDLSRTPWLEIETAPANVHWRLTVEAFDTKDGERVAADRQSVGTCRRNIAELLGISGPARLRIRCIAWGWGGSDQQTLILNRVAFVAQGPRSDASDMGGVMKDRHARTKKIAATIQPIHPERPSLRYRARDKKLWRERARSTHRIFAGPILRRIDDLETLKQQPPLPLTYALLKEGPNAWRNKLVQLRPPEAPPLKPGQGWSPFRREGLRVESTWRQFYWHFVSNLYIAAALDDDPLWIEQMRRWVLAMSEWRFWMRPAYQFFDFGTSYPLQTMALAYDTAYPAMTDAERAKVRDAIAYMARGLYLNTQTGHGAIYNDLRGNHTAVGMCGLGVAGLVLLGERPDAALWVAKAEEMMLAAFEDHTSGAWYESPSYGAYGVNEWLKLAEMLRNVTGRDHLKNPFLKRFADYQIAISDWEGRDLGYNQGGGGQYWNHWVFLKIAAELRDPEIQWLGNFIVDPDGMALLGYGDAFWWGDPTLEARKPAKGNTGRTFSDVGINVWRDGWEKDATILLHQCGAKGQHKEENMNHFTLYASGARILPDELGTKASDHNVPLIGKGQNRYTAGKTLRFHTDTIAGYSLGDAHSAYRTRTGNRHLLYLRDGALAVIDQIETGRAAEVSLQLHPNGETRAVADSVVVDSGGARLAAVFCDSRGRVSKPAVAPRKSRSKRATHDVRAPFHLEGKATLVTFLRFGPRDTVSSEAIQVNRQPDGLSFRCGGEEWRIGMKPGEAAARVRTDAPLWFARIVDGKAVSMMAVGAEAHTPVSIHTPSGETSGKGFASLQVSP